MPVLTPELMGNTFIAMIVAYLITFAYSLYSLWLNYKQAKVAKAILETNEILLENNEYLRKILAELEMRWHRVK